MDSNETLTIEQYKQQQFLQACIDGDDHIVHRLIDDPDVDVTWNKNYPIQLASQHRRKMVIEKLLDDPRVNPCDNDYAALKLVSLDSINGDKKIIKLFLNHPKIGFENMNSPIVGKIKESFEQDDDCYYQRIEESMFEVIREREREQKQTSFKLACVNNDLPTVKELIDDPDVDVAYDRPILSASRNGHLEVVKLLLEYMGFENMDSPIADKIRQDCEYWRSDFEPIQKVMFEIIEEREKEKAEVEQQPQQSEAKQIGKILLLPSGKVEYIFDAKL